MSKIKLEDQNQYEITILTLDDVKKMTNDMLNNDTPMINCDRCGKSMNVFYTLIGGNPGLGNICEACFEEVDKQIKKALE